MRKTILYLAPLRGITDFIFRNTYQEHFPGIDLSMAPFINAVKAGRITPKLFKDVLPENNSGMPVIPQLLTNCEQDFIVMAKHLFDLGYDTVNWNLGCPFPVVAKKYRGSGLLPFADRIDAFLDQTLSRIPNQVSVKTRLGRNTEKEFTPLISVFNRYPLSEIVIHPRTGVQMYNGKVDLETFEASLDTIAHPVVYNGDIDSLETFETYTNRFKNIERWMIGRGVIANPWLPWQIKTRAQVLDFERIRQFHDVLFSRYQEVMCGSSHLIDRMKGVWVYLSRSFKNGPEYFKKIKKTRSIDQYRQHTDWLFRSASGPLKPEQM